MSQQRARMNLYLSSAENLRRSLERNRDDSDFVDDGGEIVYVFDANAFIFHVDIHDEKRLTRDFDRLIGQPPRSALARTIERLTADFLFSGRLPGQLSHGYISVPHFEEVLLQTERVKRKLGHEGRRHRTQLSPLQREELRAIVEDVSTTESKLERLGRALPGAWISNLNATSHFTASLRRAFITDGGALIPLDREDWGRAASAYTAKELNDWLNILPRRGREPEAVRDDAQTLQTLVNLNRQQTESKVRHVLVTADSQLDRAVRKRIDAGELAVPNFIRSPRDYLPLLNLRAMTTALGSAKLDVEATEAFRRVFDKLESALDWLVPGKADATSNTRSSELSDLENAWLSASRSVTVLNADHLATAGADDVFQLVAEFVDDEAGRAATRLVERSVEEVRRRHVSLVLDSALADLAMARGEHDGQRPRRVGLQLVGDLFGNLLPHGAHLNAFLDQVVQLGKLPGSVLDRLNTDPGSYEAQLLSCAIFVAAERWTAGIDFGERAYELAARKYPQSVRHTEAGYLLALCLRFSLRNARQFSKAAELLESNLKIYRIRRDAGRSTHLRRLRDEMEFGNLMLAASVSQEMSVTAIGRRITGTGRLPLFGQALGRTNFKWDEACV